jgi:hypothetical protein
MQEGGVLIYPCCRLRAKIAVRGLEIASTHAMFAEGAGKLGAAAHRFGCVIPHVFILRFAVCRRRERWVCIFGLSENTAGKVFRYRPMAVRS